MKIELLPNTDLFKFMNIENVYFGHCISADAGMGKGIAINFVNNFPAIKQLRNNKHLEIGKTYLVDNVFNLITKQRYYHKPTYLSFTNAVNSLALQCNELSIPDLYIPQIGCGLDKLEWDRVIKIIEKAFNNIQTNIHVCSLGDI